MPRSVTWLLRWRVQPISLFYLQHNQRKQTRLGDCEDGQLAGLVAQLGLPVGLHGTAFRGMLQVVTSGSDVCEQGACGWLRGCLEARVSVQVTLSGLS